MFEYGQALGGHMSRRHPGKSAAYNNKTERRKEREFERKLLQHAKIKYYLENKDDKPLDRVKIRRLRKELRKHFEQFGAFEIWC